MTEKELAAYLPYEVAVLHPILIWSGNPPEPSHEEETTSLLTVENFKEHLQGYSRLVLFPLEMLTQDELKAQGFESHIDYLTHENKGVEWTLKAPYNMVEYLISKKFDVFGLIEKGEAIAVSEDFNPYK